MALSLPSCSPTTPSTPSGDSMPSQILPHLFVGDLEQTSGDIVNRLNISYILSLGLLPLISSAVVPSSSSSTNKNSNSNNRVTQLPPQNSSKDFKFRVRSAHSPPVECRQSLDCTENKAIRMARLIQCKCINIADNSEQSLTKFFNEAHQFIDDAKRKKCNILVHCLGGISRSPTIAIAYLMRVKSLRLQDAYNLVKQCRPQIDPNLSFMGQLMKYEKSLEDERKNSLEK